MLDILLFLLYDHTFRIVGLGCTILGALSAVVGTFSVLKKESLLGDAVGHASLAGVCVIFILFNTKENYYLLFGAAIVGIIIIILIHIIRTYSKVKQDSSMAILLSVFFGLGIVFLTYISGLPGSKKAGLNKFIFGQASTILTKEIYIMIALSIIILTIYLLFYKEFKISIFDKDYAQTLGINSKFFHFLLSCILVVNVIIGIQVSGAILISSLLISPSICARLWTNSLGKVLFLSALIGGLSGLIGTTISAIYISIPTGPVIAVSLSIFVLLSLLFSPNGIIFYYIKRMRYKKKITNILEGEKND